MHKLAILQTFNPVGILKIPKCEKNLGKPFQIAHRAKSNQHHQHIATPLYY